MPIILSKHLNPIIITSYVVLNNGIFTFGMSALALPDFLDSKVSKVVEFLRISSIWNFRKLMIVPNITKLSTKAINIIIADTYEPTELVLCVTIFILLNV